MKHHIRLIKNNPFCLLVMLGSIMVCAGWILQIPEVVQLAPGLAPMQLNTALCFSLLSLSLILKSSENLDLWSRGFAGMCLFIAAIAIFEHVIGTNIGIDALFVDPFVSDKTKVPGRMSIPTAVAFIGSAISTFFISYSVKKELNLVWYLGTLVALALAMTSLIEYSIDLRGDRLAGALAGMAIHTCIFHIILSLKIVQLSLSEKTGSKFKLQTLGILLPPVLIGIFLSIIAWQSILGLERKIQISALQHDADIRTNLIDSEYEAAIDSLIAVRQFFIGSEFVSEEEFNEFVQPMILSNPALMAIDWSPRVLHGEREFKENEIYEKWNQKFKSLDENRQLTLRPNSEVYFPVTYTYPRIENGIAYGFDHYSDPLRTVAMDQSARTGQPVATRPFILFRKSPSYKALTDILITLPVYQKGVDLGEIKSGDDSRIIGFIIGVVRSSTLIESVMGEVEDVGLNLSLLYNSDSGEPYISFNHFSRFHDESQDGEAELKDPLFVKVPLEIASTNWDIKVTAEDHYLEEHIAGGSTIVLLLSLFVTLLLTMYFFILKKTRDLALKSSQNLALANSKLQEREEWFSQLARSSAAGIFRTNPEGHCEYVNDAWCRITGFSPKDAHGLGWVNAIHPEDREETNYLWAEAIKHREPFEHEFRFLRPDGEIRWTIATSRAVLDAEGQIIGYVGTNYDLTERKNFEKELTKLTAMQNAIIVNAGYSIIATDTEGKILLFNSSAERMLGYKSEEMVGLKTPAEFHDPEQVVSMAAMFSEKYNQEIQPGFGTFIYEARHGLPSVHEWTYIRKDGSRFPVLLSVTAIKDEAGVIQGYLGIAADITERVRLREEVLQNEARLRLTTESVGLGTWDIDFSKDTISFSEQLCSMLGYSQEDFNKDPAFLESLCHEADRESLNKLFVNDSKQSTDLRKAEYRLQTKDGSWRWFLGMAKEMGLNKPGASHRLVGIQLDISNIKAVQKELEGATAQLESFIKYAPASVAMFDNNMCYIAHSEKWKRDYGLSGKEIIGQSHYEIFPEIGEEWKEIHKRCLAGAIEKCEAELFNRDDGSEQWLQWEVRPWLRSDGTIGGLAMFTEDITERQETLQKLAEAKSAAEAATDAKASFLANMSHEIRTPLTSIIGYAEQLLDEQISNEEQIEYTHTVVRSSEHLLELINDILDFSKIEAGKFQISKDNENLFQILKIVEESFVQKAKDKSLSFGIEFQYPVPALIETDALRVKQILINLTGNAIKFTETGGVKLVVSYSKESNQLIFKITDTGVGLTEVQASKLFSAFTQADESTTKRFGGTGLGLSISKKLAELLDGTLTVDSEYGIGSTFTLSIPAGDIAKDHLSDSESLASVAVKKIKLPSKVDGKVLIVEDVKLNQKLFKKILEKAGLKVEIAENGKIGLERARLDSFDLILMDMQMPVMDGYTATQELRRANYSNPIVGCTADASSDGRTRCMKAGCDDVLLKPFSNESIGLILNRFIVTDEQENQRPLYNITEFPDLQFEFLQRLPAKLDNIIAEIELETYSEVLRLAHNLRGASGLHEVNFLGVLARDVEEAAGIPDKEKLNQLKRELIEAKKTVSIIRSEIESQIEV